jgi:hypothetical protein
MDVFPAVPQFGVQGVHESRYIGLVMFMATSDQTTIRDEAIPYDIITEQTWWNTQT